MMHLVELDIESKIGESSQAIRNFDEEISLKLVKMAKEANEALTIQQIEVAQKIQEMQDEINREESIQTYLVKQARNQDEKKDPEYKQYENKLNNLINDFKSIQLDNRESELMNLQHTESFKKVKTDKQIYEQLATTQVSTPISNGQNSILNMRDRQQSLNKSVISCTQRNNYDDIQGWSNNDNQKLCSGVSSSHDLSQNQLQISSGLGLNRYLNKTSKFNSKPLNNKHDDNNSDGQRQNTQTNTKLYIAFPDEQIANPEYLKYDLKTRFRMQMYRLGECILIIIIIIIIFMIYQYYLK